MFPSGVGKLQSEEILMPPKEADTSESAGLNPVPEMVTTVPGMVLNSPTNGLTPEDGVRVIAGTTSNVVDTESLVLPLPVAVTVCSPPADTGTTKMHGLLGEMGNSPDTTGHPAVGPTLLPSRVSLTVVSPLANPEPETCSVSPTCAEGELRAMPASTVNMALSMSLWLFPIPSRVCGPAENVEGTVTVHEKCPSANGHVDGVPVPQVTSTDVSPSAKAHPTTVTSEPPSPAEG